jgi:hypothetical protein
LVDDPELFKRYAIQDSKITLKHINEMGKRYFELGKVGVPLTVTSIAKEFNKAKWREVNYPGYQLHAKYQMGNLSRISSPVSLQTIGSPAVNLSRFTASYRGGRNESFMYGAAEGV